MRIPRIDHYDTSMEEETIEVSDFQFEPRHYDLGNDKQKFKYISTIERMCRSSKEYKD